jgi:hypothetical protein
LLREFNRILDFLPGLYQKIVSYDERLQIVFGAGAQVSIIAPLERSETINAALVAPLRERGGYDINTFSEDAGQRYIIEIIPKTTADNEPIERLQDLDESEFQSPQLTDHFVSRYCASYTQFVSNLIKYGATIRQCAGSHKLVSYNDRSFLYPHSLQQNRFPLRKHEVIRLLTLLGITKEEFIEFFSR